MADREVNILLFLFFFLGEKINSVVANVSKIC